MFLPRGYIPGRTIIDELIDGNTLFNQLNVDNIRLDGNTISSLNTNGDIIYFPDGTGKNVFAKTVNISSGSLLMGGVDTINSSREAVFNKCNTPEIVALLASINYQYVYDWSALPELSSFPWTKVNGGDGTSYASLSDGVLTLTDPNTTSYLYYGREENNINTDDIVIVSTTMKIDSGSGKAVILVVRDGVKNLAFWADTNGVYYYDNTSNYVQIINTPSTSSYQKYTVVKHGQNNVYLFINDVLFKVIPYSGIYSSALSPYIFFGTSSNSIVVTSSFKNFQYSILKEGSRNVVGTSAQIDNINLDGNTICSTDTNGDINITPNGSGLIKVGSLIVNDIRTAQIISSTGWYRIASGAVSVNTRLGTFEIRETSSYYQKFSLTASIDRGYAPLLTQTARAYYSGKITKARIVYDATHAYLEIYASAACGAGGITYSLSNNLYWTLQNIAAGDATGYSTVEITLGQGIVSSGYGQFGNLKVSVNTLSSEDTNGDINLTPNGTGSVVIPKLTISPLTVTDNSTYVRLLNSGCLDFYDNGYILLASAGSQKIKLQSSAGVGIDVQGSIYPTTDNTYSLGASGYRWTEVWATNGTIQTSDARNKTDILSSDLGLNFVNSLQPVSFRWNDGKRRHYGILAQDVEFLLDGKDFAGFIKDLQTGEYGLRYHEFLCPMIKAIQELNEKVEKYENTRFVNILKRLFLKILKKF